MDAGNTREILDCFVLLANSDTFLEAMSSNGLDELLKILKVPAFGESRDKIDILAGTLASIQKPKAMPKSFDLD